MADKNDTPEKKLISEESLDNLLNQLDSEGARINLIWEVVKKYKIPKKHVEEVMNYHIKTRFGCPAIEINFQNGYFEEGLNLVKKYPRIPGFQIAEEYGVIEEYSNIIIQSMDIDELELISLHKYYKKQGEKIKANKFKIKLIDQQIQNKSYDAIFTGMYKSDLNKSETKKYLELIAQKIINKEDYVRGSNFFCKIKDSSINATPELIEELEESIIEKGIEYYQEMSKTEPEKYKWGLINLEKKKKELELNKLIKSAKIDKNYKKIVRSCIKLEKFDIALEYSRKANLIKQEIKCLQKLGKFEEFIQSLKEKEDYKKLIKTYKILKDYKSIAKYYEKKGNYLKAIEFYRKHEKTKSNDPSGLKFKQGDEFRIAVQNGLDDLAIQIIESNNTYFSAGDHEIELANIFKRRDVKKLLIKKQAEDKMGRCEEEGKYKEALNHAKKAGLESKVKLYEKIIEVVS